MMMMMMMMAMRCEEGQARLRSCGTERKQATTHLSSQLRHKNVRAWKQTVFEGWEKLNRGGFQTRGGSHFFWERFQIVSRTLSGLFLVGALNRPRRRKQDKSEKIPGPSPSKSGKSPGNSKKDKIGQERKDKSRSGNPHPFETPPLSGPWN